MQHKIYTVFDTKSEAYLQPFFLQTNGQAIRSFTDCVNDPQHQFARHPEDYTLFEIGEYDDSTCAFKLSKSPKSLGVAVEFIKA